MDLEFTVKSYDTSEKLEDGIRKKQVKIRLASDEGHRLTLIGGEEMKKGFPLNEVINVKIESFRTLEDYTHE